MWSSSPSEFWRDVLPLTLKACFGVLFFSVKLQLLVTLLGLFSAPSSGPGDWTFPFTTGALEGLGNTLSFRLALRLQRASKKMGNLAIKLVCCKSIQVKQITMKLYLLFLMLCCLSLYIHGNFVKENSTDMMLNLTSGAMQKGQCPTAEGAMSTYEQSGAFSGSGKQQEATSKHAREAK